MPNDNQKKIDELRKDLEDLIAEVYRNNFTSSKDENKYIRFKTRVRVPTYASSPATCEVGELYVNTGNGKLYVCSAANTWSAQT